MDASYHWIIEISANHPFGSQTSSAIYHPQHDTSRENKSPGTARVDPDALLHTTYADPKSMYRGREGKGCFERFQDVEGMSMWSKGRNEGIADLGLNTVQLSSKCLGWIDTWSQKGQLVDKNGLLVAGGWCVGVRAVRNLDKAEKSLWTYCRWVALCPRCRIWEGVGEELHMERNIYKAWGMPSIIYLFAQFGRLGVLPWRVCLRKSFHYKSGGQTSIQVDVLAIKLATLPHFSHISSSSPLPSPIYFDISRRHFWPTSLSISLEFGTWDSVAPLPRSDLRSRPLNLPASSHLNEFLTYTIPP